MSFTGKRGENGVAVMLKAESMKKAFEPYANGTNDIELFEAGFQAGIEYAKQWISVEDELPKESGYYLCAICKTIRQALFYNDELEEWYEFYLTKEEHLDCEDLTKKVTHWMPMPAPPKEGGTRLPYEKDEIKGNQGKISPNYTIGNEEHIQVALDVIDKKGGEQ